MPPEDISALADITTAAGPAEAAFGPVSSWPLSLRVLADFVFRTDSPACVFWSGENLMLYNGAWSEAMTASGSPAQGTAAETVSPALAAACRRLKEIDTPANRIALGRALLPLTWRHAVGLQGCHATCLPALGDDGKAAAVLVRLEGPAVELAPPAASEAKPRFGFLLQLTDTLNQLDDPAAIPSEGARLVAEEIRTGHAFFTEIDLQARSAQVHVDYRRDPTVPSLSGIYDISRHEAAFESLCQGYPLVLSDIDSAHAVPAAASLRALRAWSGGRFRAHLSVPVLRGGTLVSIMSVQSDQPRDWMASDIASVQQAAVRTGLVQERARAETRLRRSESLHRALFDGVDDGVCLLERLPLRPDGLRDYRCVKMNPAMQKMFGLPDLSGQRLRDNFPEAAEAWYDDFDHAFETGEPVRLERESKAYGMVLELFLARIEDARGRILMAVVQDVTARKRAEELLQQSEERQTFLLSLGDALRPLTDPALIRARATCLLHDHLRVSRAEYIVRVGHTGSEAEVHGADDDATASGTDLLFAAWLPAEVARLRAGRTVVVTDMDGVGDGSRARLGVPLIREGRLVAALCLHHAEPREWTAFELELCHETAERTWNAVERARALTALRDSERHFRALVNATSYAVYRMSPNWRELHDLDGGGFLKDTREPTTDWLAEYIDPEDQPTVRATIDEAIRTKTVFQLEHRVKRPDGTLGWTYSRAIPLLDPQGAIIEWFGAASDVTERKQVEEAARLTGLRLRLAQEASGVATFDWLIQGNKGCWSPELLDMLGLREGALGGTFEDWVAMIHPDDRAEATRRIEMALEIGDLEGEWRVIRPDGEVMWTLVRGQVVYDSHNRPERLTGAQVDITERVLSEQRVRLLHDHIQTQIEALRCWQRPRDT